jgi:hypothetical protein
MAYYYSALIRTAPIIVPKLYVTVGWLNVNLGPALLFSVALLAAIILIGVTAAAPRFVQPPAFLATD